MKASLFQSLLAGGLLAGIAAGCATGPVTSGPAKSASAPSPCEEESELTGSYLKQRITRNGFITDSAGHVVVIDEEAIKRSGARDVREVLVKTGHNR
jgi:outer membrane cobalamin receptor